jgi:hypothetical protein
MEEIMKDAARFIKVLSKHQGALLHFVISASQRTAGMGYGLATRSGWDENIRIEGKINERHSLSLCGKLGAQPDG